MFGGHGFAGEHDPAEGGEVAGREVAALEELDEGEGDGVPVSEAFGLGEFGEGGGEEDGFVGKEDGGGAGEGTGEEAEGGDVEVEGGMGAEAVAGADVVGGGGEAGEGEAAAVGVGDSFGGAGGAGGEEDVGEVVFGAGRIGAVGRGGGFCLELVPGKGLAAEGIGVRTDDEVEGWVVGFEAGEPTFHVGVSEEVTDAAVSEDEGDAFGGGGGIDGDEGGAGHEGAVEGDGLVGAPGHEDTDPVAATDAGLVEGGGKGDGAGGELMTGQFVFAAAERGEIGIAFGGCEDGVVEKRGHRARVFI